MDGWIGCCRRAGQGSRPSPNCRFQGSWAWPPAAAVAAAAAAAVACPSPPRGRPAPRRGLDAARSKPGRARESGRPKPTKAPVKGATQGPRPGTWERLAPQTRTSMEAPAIARPPQRRRRAFVAVVFIVCLMVPALGTHRVTELHHSLTQTHPYTIDNSASSAPLSAFRRDGFVRQFPLNISFAFTSQCAPRNRP